MAPPPLSSKLINDLFLPELHSKAGPNKKDDPNYWASTPHTLVATARAINFKVGTGFQLLSDAFAKCEGAHSEVIIVTCFWAKSPSQEALCALLKKLSVKGVEQKRKIEIRLCFSSLSIKQKLFHTFSLNGKVYPDKTWVELGLPSSDELPGVNMIVKSIFILPFSVIHSKYIIVDRKLAFMPSCNVSWEKWFEGCVEFQGDIVKKLHEFWVAFWERKHGSTLPPLRRINDDDFNTPGSYYSDRFLDPRRPMPSSLSQTTTYLLPSPHHINPRFGFIFSISPPSTPLNMFVLQILGQAQKNICIQSPNITCRKVIDALFAALARGVHVALITSSNLMVMEQIVTAGTTTERQITKMKKRWNRMNDKYETSPDPESAKTKPGILSIWLYKPKEGIEDENEAVKSHLKLTIVDDFVTVLGSGNMDRASFYTSQELGVAICCPDFTKDLKRIVDKGLVNRLDKIF